MFVDLLDLEELGLAVAAFQTAALVVWAVAEAVRGLRTRSSAMVSGRVSCDVAPGAP